MKKGDIPLSVSVDEFVLLLGMCEMKVTKDAEELYELKQKMNLYASDDMQALATVYLTKRIQQARVLSDLTLYLQEVARYYDIFSDSTD